MEAVPGAHRGKVKKGLEPDHLEKGGQLSEHGLEIAWPQDARTVFQGTLCGIAVLACLYVAQDIVLPVVLALVHVITLSRLW